MLWANGPVADDVKTGHIYVHEHPFNVGQHVAHNEMLDECVRVGVDFHVRIDDDCWIGVAKWKTAMLANFANANRNSWTRMTMGIDVSGLNNPPETIKTMEFAGGDGLKPCRFDIVNILGGIFRMTPMPIMRYFRWDERLPMGMGEARQFANFCDGAKIDMIRVLNVKATHGDSTAKQEVNREWAYEHDALQFLPLGL